MGTLKLNNIRKSYGPVDVIKGIDLDVRDGELVVFVGPSGCGKSTLLRIIAGLEDANSGEVRIDDQVVNQTPPAKRGIAMVFQSYALYPHLDVQSNMGLGLKQAGKPAAEIEARVKQASNMLSLESYLKRRPAELSGGQRQRVAIGRALVREPKLFLFDEPLSNLDAALRVNTRLEIAKLHRQLSATMIYVTHDQVEAMTLANRIVVLNAGQIEQVGAPMDLYNAPDNEFVAGFIGSPKMNIFDAGTLSDGQVKRIGVRPEHITLDSNSGQWKGSVVHVEQLGADTNVYLDTEEAGLLTVRIFGQYAVEPGSVIYATPVKDKIHRFDGEGRAIR
ncbi:ABC transporter ATP-binding protein [Pseudochrobactrum sp. MP213Fo]|uniref:ABC transporter ATP-binding protein n=1 Tax=Pseudochrobactrum sp. MP213Fo TaxID=3022250 RepID=UPI003BA0B415